MQKALPLAIPATMMSYQTILVYIDQTPEARTRLRIAAGLGRAFSARLIGIYVDDTQPLTPTVAALLPNEVVAEQMRRTGDAQRAAEELFRQEAAAAGLSDIEWRAPAGAPIEAAVAHARCVDLVVAGQPSIWEAEWSFGAELAAAVLLESGRPMLFIPHVGAREAIGTNVIVAWDGGREASRALADAMPFLARARQVTVACLDPVASARGADANARERLAAYLRRHGIAPRIEYDNLGEGDIAVGDWLLSRAADWGGDLIVMGGYGRPRWRERVLGGATRALLQAMTIPVLMAH